MARPLRIQFAGAIYHAIARGNARQPIFRADQPPVNLFADVIDGWLLGSQVFVDRIKKLMQEPQHTDQLPQARKFRSLPLATVLDAAAQHFQVAPAVFAEKRSPMLARDIAAWLVRRLTTLTLRELAETFGLTHPDSAANCCVRRCHIHGTQRVRLLRAV